jgi:hypothetical protein
VTKKRREEWRFHPLIHTYAGFNLPPDIEKKKAEPKLRMVFEK